MLFTFLLFFFTLLHPTLIDAQQQTGDGCYNHWQQVRVSCTPAYDKRSGVSDQQCRTMCNSNTACRAVQYSRSAQSCQFYRSFTTRRNKRDTGGHEIEKRHSCGGYPGPPQGRFQGKKKRQACCQPGLTRANDYTYYRSTRRCCPSARPATTQPPLPAGAACPSGQVARYYLIEGYQLSGNADFTFRANNEQACVDACTNNRLPSGRQAPCRSFDFDVQSSTCSISYQPSGVPSSSPNSQLHHYEKVCVDAGFGQRCPGPYFRGPQRILVGYAQTVVTASSPMDCLQICANAPSRFGFTCKSVMFYYQENNDNCILNSETRSTHPEVYVPETTDQVDYFEPGCYPTRSSRDTRSNKRRNRNVLKLNSATYGNWTMCDGKKLEHKRFRQCLKANPHDCEVDANSCDPAKEQQYDTPEADPDMSSNHSILASTGASNSSSTGTNRTQSATTTVPPQTKSNTKSTSRSPGIAGVCQPLIKPDGTKDCQTGMRMGANGQRENCQPSKTNC